jgi:hypothetical protein
MSPGRHKGSLLAVSDLHIGYQENRALVEKMCPDSDDDWLLVAGGVAETVESLPQGCLGPRETMDCGATPGTASPCVVLPATHTGPARPAQ